MKVETGNFVVRGEDLGDAKVLARWLKRVGASGGLAPRFTMVLSVDEAEGLLASLASALRECGPSGDTVYLDVVDGVVIHVARPSRNPR